ncbi:MAG: tetratricopeptide repeat protein [Thermomonas sp.]
MSLLTVAVLWIASASVAIAGSTKPYVPANDNVVLEHLPSTSDPRVRAFAGLRQQVTANARDAAPAVALATAYLNYGRDTGDARYLGRAQAVIAPWARRTPPVDSVMLVQATILQSRHQFEDSRQILKALLKRDRDNPQAWLTLASVDLVQGRMDEARSDCAHLFGNVDGLYIGGCLASWSVVNGKAAAALQTMEAFTAQSKAVPAALQAWVHGLQADAAKALGDAKRADAEYKLALQYAPGDNFLLATYADFLLDHDRAREALELTRGYSQSDTSFLRQALAEAALGLPAAKVDIAQMQSRFRDLEARGDNVLYAREQARFVLDGLHDPVQALQLARNNWTLQRAPEDIRVYLEAALAAGQPQAAQDPLDLVARTKLEDPIIRALVNKLADAGVHAQQPPEPKQ